MSIRNRLMMLLMRAMQREKDETLTEVKLRPTAKIKIRVYRAATDKWETIKEA